MKMKKTIQRILRSLLLLLCIALPAAASDDWPQFRGPRGDGHADAAELPLRWSESENVCWKTPVAGRAWSSPVVWSDQIWLTTAIEKPATPEEVKRKLAAVDMYVPSPHVARSVTLKAICLDRRTGKTKHDLTLFELDDPPQICKVNSFASPTPVIESGRLYCDFGTMGTVCLDTATGRVIWKNVLPIEHQVGPGSSPVIHENLLVLVRDGCHVQYVTALDKQTGKPVWKTDRPPIDATNVMLKKAFSTPLLIDTPQGSQMIIPGAQWIVSYDPKTGKPRWRVNTGPTFSNTSRPVFGHGMVFVGTAFGGSHLLAIRVDGHDDVTDSHVAWKISKQVPKRSSPLLVGDELYMVSDGGVLTCLDARTGEIHYTERLGENFSASPTCTTGGIYFCSEKGTTTIIRPGKEFVQLAENHLDHPILASPAVTTHSLLLRTEKHLYRIEK